MCIFQTDLNEQLFHTAPANSFRNRPRPIQKPNRNDDKYSTNLTNKRANLSNRSNKEEYKKSPNYSLSLPFSFFITKQKNPALKKKKKGKRSRRIFCTRHCANIFRTRLSDTGNRSCSRELVSRMIYIEST